MVRYTAKRLLAAALTLTVILTLSFFVVRLMPGNVYDDPNLDAETAALLRQRAQLDRPIGVQYLYFLRGVLLEGDWGLSVKVEPGVPAFRVLAGRIPVSLRLNVAALALGLAFGLAAGTAAALMRGRAADWGLSAAVIACISVPSFVVAALLQYTVAYRLGWLPILYEPTAGPGRHLASMVLPVAALALGPAATVTRHLRGELVEILGAEYMLLAKSKGLHRRQAVLRHGLRNASVTLLTLVMPMLANVLGGSMVVERLFSIPGVGGTMIRAIRAGDHSLTVAALVFYGMVASLTGLVNDLLYGVIDPRIRLGVPQDG